MPNSGLSRRKLIRGSLTFAGASWLIGSQARAGNTLLPTPPQTAGPFYPLSFPRDSDDDLIHVAGHPEQAKGTVIRITGRILAVSGRPISGARVEIWQCDANGRYHYVRDDRAGQPRDENFQGYGATTTGTAGAYQFLTIKPVPYPGRTPHIHFAVVGPGFERFVTQMYVAGEAGNESDPVLLGVRDAAARAKLIVPLRVLSNAGPAVFAGTFDIVVGGRAG
jgi:protocatechuate 3,4-dioxygenase, beta subunit